MSTYIALLRGIAPMNPNMKNEKLREVFEDLGFQNVKTVISSGNVIFDSSEKDSKKLEKLIEKTLPEKLGFTSSTIIRSKESLEKLVAQNPFGELDHSKKTSLNVTFLKNPTKVSLTTPFQVENKTYRIVEMSDNYICSVIDITRDKTPDLMVWLENTFGKEITTRSWKTVERILKKMIEADRK